MALSHELAEAGSAPKRLEATATVTFKPGEGVSASEIAVRGVVPGIDQASFAEAATAASEGCPISAAQGNVAISVDPTLEG